MAEKELKEERGKGLVVFADFEIDGKQYKKGQSFIPPVNYKQDPEHDRALKAQGGSQKGRTFTIEIPPLLKDGEIQLKRFVLPVE